MSAPDTTPNELLYSLDATPGVSQSTFAALAHVLASFVGIITPTLIIGGVLGLGEHIPYLISMALFVSGAGTLIQAWASQKSFRRKDGSDDPDPDGPAGRNAERNFRGEKRSNETHQSTTDPEARLARKSRGSESRLAYMGHTVMENRHGLIVKAAASLATGTAERDVAAELLAQLPGQHRKTVGADKNYDTRGFVTACRALNITPHVSRNTKRTGGSAIDGRTSRHAGYQISMRLRKRVEEPFGRGKKIGPIRQVMLRGRDKVHSLFQLTMMGWNLIRMRNLQA